MNKTEMNLMERVMNSGIEFKVELYKALESNIKEQLAVLNNIMGMNTTEVKPIAPVVEDVKSEPKKEEKVEAPKVKAEEKKEIKANHKVSNVKKLINCGPSEGNNEVLFVEKRRDSKHLWYGQIRYNNQIRNFHWSNELPMAIVYGIESFADLKDANELIKAAVKEISPKELTKYDQVLDHADFGGCKARFYYGALEQGAFIYLTPEANDSDKQTDIIAKGYTDSHAFIVRRDGEVFWRNYNFIFSKKPFESTPSKGFDIKLMCEDVDILFEAVCRKYDKAASEEARKAVKITKDNNNDPMTADLSSLY